MHRSSKLSPHPDWGLGFRIQGLGFGVQGSKLGSLTRRQHLFQRIRQRRSDIRPPILARAYAASTDASWGQKVAASSVQFNSIFSPDVLRVKSSQFKFHTGSNQPERTV
jgi:hypothetical protein